MGSTGFEITVRGAIDEATGESLCWAVLEDLDGWLQQSLASTEERDFQEVIGDVLLETSAASGKLEFSFRDPGGDAGPHWYQLALAARRPEIDAIARRHGVRLELAAGQEEDVLLVVDARIGVCAVSLLPADEAHVSGDDGMIEISSLDEALRQRIYEIRTSGTCGCSLCRARRQ